MANFTSFIINGNVTEFTSPICNPYTAAISGYYGISGSLTVKLNAGDTIGILAQINGSTKVVSLLGDQNISPVGHYCFFSGSSFANNIDTKVGNATFNLGWTSPGYDDLLYGATDILASSNTTINTISFQDSVGNPSGVIPASTDVYINIISASTAVTDTQTFYFLGYYLF